MHKILYRVLYPEYPVCDDFVNTNTSQMLKWMIKQVKLLSSCSTRISERKLLVVLRNRYYLFHGAWIFEIIIVLLFRCRYGFYILQSGMSSWVENWYVYQINWVASWIMECNPMKIIVQAKWYNFWHKY